MNLLRRLLWPTLLVLFFAALPKCQAGFMATLTAATPVEENGIVEYSYTLANLGSSDLPAVALFISVPPDANLQSITGPNGWAIGYQPGDSLISWQSTGDSFDLLPATSAVFSFDSVLAPGTQPFSVFGFQAFPLQVGEIDGTTVAPASLPSVPEPASLLTFLTGSIVLIGALPSRPRRKKNKVSAMNEE